MKPDDPCHDPRSTDEIIAAMLAHPARDSDTYEDDSYWSNRAILACRVSRETLAAAVRLCESPCVIEQRTGCDILSLLGAPDMPFRRESLAPVLSVLRRASDLETLNTALSTLGNIGDGRAISDVIGLRNHSEPSVRLTVAMALPGFREARLVVPSLIELTRDTDEDVRDWAVFGLINSFDDDTREIRQAFLDRLADPNATVRGQAFLGLARRRVPGTLDAIAREFDRAEIHPDAVEAASELGDPRGMELLERLRARFPDWDVVPYEMERLRKA
jgi:hypothetical protein